MKVLVVDDEKGIRQLLEMVAEKNGCEVLCAENGEQGLVGYEEFQPDLVFTDVVMPKMDGLGLLEKIREISHETIVVLMTGMGSEDTAVKALRGGANNYLAKPLKHTDIVRLIRKYEAVIEERQVTRHLERLIMQRRIVMRIDNHLGLSARVANFLVSETGELLLERDRLQVALGLGELLTNAIEHGNLNITYDEKEVAFDAPGGLGALYSERLADVEFSQHRVVVDYTYEEEGNFCEWTITDKGKGFDWTNLPDPLAPDRLRARHGRGIFLCKKIFDELEWTPPGNKVRARKLVRKEPGEGAEGLL